MRKTSFIHILLMLFMVSGISAQESRQLSPEAENLLQYLKEIEGEKTLSGTTANVNWNINEAKWVNKHTGKWPALNFFDFIHLPFSPSNWIDYSNITEVYNWHKNGGIVGCMWHWNMPTNDGQDWTCTPGTGNKETGFDVRKIFEPESDEYKQMRMRNNALYRQYLSKVPGIRFQPLDEDYVDVAWMNAIVVDSQLYGHTKDELMAFLKENMVDTRLLFVGMHRQPCLNKFGADCSGVYPVTDWLSENGLYLPSASSLSESDIKDICQMIASFAKH